MTAAVAVIDLEALQSNLDRVRTAAPACRILAVIKANAYGHDQLIVAKALSAADAFAVASIDEAVALRASGIEHSIVVLKGFTDSFGAKIAMHYQLEVVVHSEQQLTILETDDCDGQLLVWLKVDSGMHRLGFAPDAVPEIVQRLNNAAGVALPVRLMTHLACAEDPGNTATANQLEVFGRSIGHWCGDVSIANSAAILTCPAALQSGSLVNFQGDNWVRPGLMLYGASPVDGQSAAALGLQPVMSFETRLISVRQVKHGGLVGYGGDWQASRDSIIGVAAVGYADGYPRRLRNGTPVCVNGVTAPLVGRVSMDMITIDLTDCPTAAIGDRVVLWGGEPTIDEIAGLAETISYELMSGLTQRVSRAIRQKSPS